MLRRGGNCLKLSHSSIETESHGKITRPLFSALFTQLHSPGLSSLCMLNFRYTVTMEGGISDVGQQHCYHVQPATQVWERADSALTVGALLLDSF